MLAEAGRGRGQPDGPVALALVLLGATAAGWAAERLHVPAPWLVGPLAVTVLLRLAAGLPRAVPGGFLVAAQVVLGLGIGLSSRPDALRTVGHSAGALLLVVVVTTAASVLGGYLLARWTGIDVSSGLLGSLPGAASGIVAMSTNLGTDPRVVATLQYLRVVAVAAAGPLLTAALEGWIGSGRLPAPGPPAGAGGAAARAALAQAGGVAGAPLWIPPSHYPALAAAACLAALLAGRLRLPAPNFLGPFTLGLALRWAGVETGTVPPVLQSLALALIGVSVGARFDRGTLALLGRAAAVDLGIIAGLLALSTVTGYAFHLAAGVDVATALLGALPGAMDAITAAAHDLGADTAVVAAMHLTRFLVIALAGPFLAMWLSRRVGGSVAGGCSQR